MNTTKPVLRQGDNGPSVRELQILLKAHLTGQRNLAIDGDFGRKTLHAVKVFQRSVRLSDNGVVDADTWRRLLEHRQLEEIYKYPAGPQELLVDIAVPYIGATESRGNRMGNDPRMREIFEADRLTLNGATDGYPWCCAFVSMCVQKLIDQSIFYSHVTKPRTPSVSNFRTRWATSQNCLVFAPDNQIYSPHKGDIVVYKFSHIGIVESVLADGSLNTIEGNTNQAGSREGTTLRRKVRPINIVRCLIRLPVPKSYNFEQQMCELEPRASVSYSTEDFLRGYTSPHDNSVCQSFPARLSSSTSDSGLIGHSRGRIPGATGL